MLQAFINIWRVAELRTKLLFTLGMLAIYRIGFWIPLPAVNQEELKAYFEKASQTGSAAGQLAQYISIFTGGALGQSTLFGLGIMPYISAAIIFQLLGTVVPSLEALQKEGPAGRQKIQEYTRYATVALCLVQAVFWLSFIQNQDLVYAQYRGSITFWTCGVLGLTAGTIFLVWLGEQVDKYGIGNGASLIITAGIIARMPSAIQWIYDNFEFSTTAGVDKIGPMKLLFLIAAFVLVVGGSVVITQGQRRIPVQQAKHTRGRRVYGGQKSYLPLRVNHGGVMPIIFASSLMMFPALLFGWLASTLNNDFTVWLQDELRDGKYLYVAVYVGMIYFFAYFWTTVQFQPKEMSIQLRDHGSIIPGLRPGPRTAEYLERVMERITYVGAGFLAIIAVVPTVISSRFSIPMFVSSFLGGTGLLITVSVCLDFIQRIESALLMRNYSGFLGNDQGGKGPRIRGARS